MAKGTSKQGIIAALHGMRDRPGRDIILGVVEYPIMMVIGEQDKRFTRHVAFGTGATDKKQNHFIP